MRKQGTSLKGQEVTNKPWRLIKQVELSIEPLNWAVQISLLMWSVWKSNGETTSSPRSSLIVPFHTTLKLGKPAYCNRLLSAEHMHVRISSNLHKAVEAAIHARQWTKAVQILELQDPSQAAVYYQQIAEHYASVKDYQLAEEYFMKGELIQEIMEMYLKADRWEEAYPYAQKCMSQEEIHGMYIRRAREMQADGKFREAEKLFVVVGEPDLAISMYKKAKQFDAMTRLVSTYHKDLLEDTHLHLAKVRH